MCTIKIMHLNYPKTSPNSWEKLSSMKLLPMPKVLRTTALVVLDSTNTNWEICV